MSQPAISSSIVHKATVYIHSPPVVLVVSCVVLLWCCSCRVVCCVVLVVCCCVFVCVTCFSSHLRQRLESLGRDKVDGAVGGWTNTVLLAS